MIRFSLGQGFFHNITVREKKGIWQNYIFAQPNSKHKTKTFSKKLDMPLKKNCNFHIKYAKYLFKQEETSKMSDVSLKDFMYSCI